MLLKFSVSTLNLYIIVFSFHSITYILAVPPSVVSIPSGVVEAKVGSVFEIVCEARGIPQPIIMWRRHGKSESVDNSPRLFVEVKNRDMSGPIECIATNGVGEAISGINLVVQCK